MGTYSIVLDVTLEQEEAIKVLFATKHWNYIRRSASGNNGIQRDIVPEAEQQQTRQRAKYKLDSPAPKVKLLATKKKNFANSEYKENTLALDKNQPRAEEHIQVINSSVEDKTVCSKENVSKTKVQNSQKIGHVSDTIFPSKLSQPAPIEPTVVSNERTVGKTLAPTLKSDNSGKQPEIGNSSSSSGDCSSANSSDKPNKRNRKQKLTVKEDIQDKNPVNDPQSSSWKILHLSLNDSKVKNKWKYLKTDYKVKGNVIKKENVIICSPMKGAESVTKNEGSKATKTNPMVSKLVQTRSTCISANIDTKHPEKELHTSKLDSNLSDCTSAPKKQHFVATGKSEKAYQSSDALKSWHKRGKHVQSTRFVINSNTVKSMQSLNEKGHEDVFFANSESADTTTPVCSTNLHRKNKLLEQTSLLNPLNNKNEKAVCEPNFTLQSLLAITAVGHSQTSTSTSLKERTLSDLRVSMDTGSQTICSQSVKESVISNNTNSALTYAEPRTEIYSIQPSVQTKGVLDARSLNDMKLFLENPLKRYTTARNNKKKSLKNKIVNTGASDKNLNLEKAVLSLLPKDIAANVRNQLKIRRTQSGPKSSKLMCPYCPNYGLVSPISFIKHLERHAKGDYICKACGKEFTDKRNLNAHMYKTRFGTSTIITCDLCDFQAKSKCMLRRHQARAHVEQDFQCHVCAKTFKSRSYFTVHLQEAHKVIDTETHQCNMCGKICRRAAWLERHMKQHQDIGMENKCSVCHKQFKSRRDLIAHGKIHRERKYKCKICSKRFLSNTKLEIHTKTHTGEKPFSCILCEYKSNQKGNYDKHMQRHERDEERKIKEESFEPRKRYDYLNLNGEISTFDQPACVTAPTVANASSLVQSTSVANFESLVHSATNLHQDLHSDFSTPLPSTTHVSVTCDNGYDTHERYKPFNQYAHSYTFENHDIEEDVDGDEYDSDTEYTTDEGDDTVETTPTEGTNPSFSSFVSANLFSSTNCLQSNTASEGQGLEQQAKYTAVPCSSEDFSAVGHNTNIDHLSTSDIIKQFGQQGDLDLDTEALLNFQKCATNVEQLLNQFDEQAFSPYAVPSGGFRKDADNADKHSPFQNDWNIYNTVTNPTSGACASDNVDLTGLYQAVQDLSYADYANYFSNTNVTDSPGNIPSSNQDYYRYFGSYPGAECFTAETGGQVNQSVPCPANPVYPHLPIEPPGGCNSASADPDIGKMLTGKLNTPEQTYMDLQTKSYQSRQSL